MGGAPFQVPLLPNDTPDAIWTALLQHYTDQGSGQDGLALTRALVRRERSASSPSASTAFCSVSMRSSCTWSPWSCLWPLVISSLALRGSKTRVSHCYNAHLLSKEHLHLVTQSTSYMLVIVRPMILIDSQCMQSDSAYDGSTCWPAGA